jgi:hypothetical protein
MVMQAEMIELGLVKACSHVIVSETAGRIFRDFCGAETIAFGGKCSKHDNTADLVKQEKAARERTVMIQRRYIEDELFPKLTKRIEEIIGSEEAKDADIIKIWQTTMDRIGLAAVQGLVVEGNVKVDAPLDILRAMLQPTTDLDDVVDGEIVE